MRSLLDGITAAMRSAPPPPSSPPPLPPTPSAPPTSASAPGPFASAPGPFASAPGPFASAPGPFASGPFSPGTAPGPGTASASLGTAAGRLGGCGFSAEAPAEAPFSVLLLTQNIGGIDPFACAEADGDNGGSRHDNIHNTNNSSSGKGDQSKGGNGGTVPVGAQRAVREFLTELRAQLHELCRRDTAANPPPLVDVIVLHFQEIGGKRRHAAFNAFFADSLKTFLPEAGWTSGLLMESDPERFTALGSIVFLSQRMCPISSMLSFRHRTFVAVSDDPCTYVSSPAFLFHAGKFAGASRKGFLLTSLRFGTVSVNFLNVHLFHDACNTEAARVPGLSCFAERRQSAMLEAIAESVAIVSPLEPLFVFGDFNTRLDAAGLLQYAKESLHMDVELSAKRVEAPEGFWNLFSDPQQIETAQKFDVEPQRMMDIVAQQSGVEFAEFAVYFSPTYLRVPLAPVPSSVGEKEQTTTTTTTANTATATTTGEGTVPATERAFAQKRIPAWCDRVLWNPAALELMTGRRTASAADESSHRCVYQSFAFAHTDHDGVALFFLGN